MIFYLFVLNLLGFGWSRVVRGQVREGVELGCFVMAFGVNLSGSLGRE